MNTIQEEILNKFKKALSNEDLEKLKKKNSNITLKIGIVLIAIATIISILRVISNSLIDTNFYILSFWPLLLIGSILIIANVWFKSDLNRIAIQKNLIEKGFDVYNLSEKNNFEHIQEFGHLLFKDIDSFLHSDKELILTLREIFYYENELKILSASGLPKELSFYFRNEIKINNKPFYLYNQLYGYITKNQEILLKRLKDLLNKLNEEEIPHNKLLIKNEIDSLQKRICLPVEFISEYI